MLYFPIESLFKTFNNLIYIVHLYFAQYNIVIFGVVLSILGVHRIIFGKLPKPNIRQFCRIFGRSQCDAVFRRISSIRHIEMLPVEAKINKH